jgi:carboxynorspermidine decarboxylase
VILEPGEAVALHTGVLVATVLDIVNNGLDIAILDTSAATHMPDVLEMPYRPNIVDAGEPGQLPHTYRLGGLSCLAGDVIGDYSFAQPLKVGDKLIFLDMAHYSMVKTNTFNGVRLPSICTWRPPSMSSPGLTGGSIINQASPEKGTFKVVRKFGYEDFKERLS